MGRRHSYRAANSPWSCRRLTENQPIWAHKFAELSDLGSFLFDMLHAVLQISLISEQIRPDLKM